MASSSAPTSFSSTRTAGSDASDANKLQFVIKSLLAKTRTSMPVQVMAVTNDGGVSPIGFVDIQPLVGQVDGSGKVTPHGTIYNCPYMRIQGGANAVILDPQVGDIGMASFCDRDISAVKSSKAAAPPGSKRRHDMSDAIYLFTILSTAAPTQYVQFNADGIAVVSPVAVSITAPAINLVGDVAVTGTLTDNGVNVGSTHIHAGGTIGGGDTDVPH